MIRNVYRIQTRGSFSPSKVKVENWNHSHRNRRMANQSSTGKVKGSLPCGNPKRYSSHDVIQMQNNGRNCPPSSSSADCQEETESSQYLQTLLQRQIQTDITLKEQFAQHREFAGSSSLASSVDKLDGLHSLDDHAKLNALDSQVQYLQSCGLSPEEIVFTLKKKSSSQETSEKRRGFGADPIVEERIRQDIQEKISQKEAGLDKPDEFKGGLELSRQALVLERSMLEKQNKESTIPTCLFRQKKVEVGHPDDPINHIPEMLADIDPKPCREPRRDRRRKRKLHQKLLRQQKYLGVDSNPQAQEKFKQSLGLIEVEEDGLNDMLGLEETGFVNISNISSKEESECSNSLDSTVNVESISKNSHAEHGSVCRVKKKKAAKQSEEFSLSDIKEEVSFLTPEEITANRLSMKEILALDKFQYYKEGDPSKVVFVKNLPNNITAIELVSLFGQFCYKQPSNISFRLLHGRMKGQAFVTFPDSAMAARAIQQLSGYLMKGKPVILSFGKKQNS